MTDALDYKVGETYDVRENYGRGRIIHQTTVVRLTATQVVTSTMSSERRWNRKTGLLRDSTIYGDRKLCARDEAGDGS